MSSAYVCRLDYANVDPYPKNLINTETELEKKKKKKKIWQANMLKKHKENLKLT